MNKTLIKMLKNGVTFAVGLGLFSMGDWLTQVENVHLVLQYYSPVVVARATFIGGIFFTIGSFLLFTASKNIVRHILGKNKRNLIKSFAQRIRNFFVRIPQIGY